MTSMNALVMRGGAVHLETVDIPEPGPGQVLVKSLACGICGSDLHITRHFDEVFSFYRELGIMDPGLDDSAGVMLGHEYCAEIVRYGPDTTARLAPGTRVTAVPVLDTLGGAGIGVTPGLAGALAEYFLVDEQHLLEVPGDLPAVAVALTEPLAVGLHAVNRSPIRPGDVALVAGCGAIGLSVIAALARRGIGDIVASDPAPGNRERALGFGAALAVDPREQDEVGLAAERAGEGRVVIFECVGQHRLIDDFIRRAPPRAALVITGIHTADATINHAHATVKELDISYSYYYNPQEFAECLTALGDGGIPWQSMVSGTVGMDGAAGAFELLSGPSDHVKVVVEPWRSGPLQRVVPE